MRLPHVHPIGTGSYPVPHRFGGSLMLEFGDDNFRNNNLPIERWQNLNMSNEEKVMDRG
jgi:hypothetical protein